VAVEVVLTRAVSQLPTLTFPGWDDFGQITRTLQQLENGVFRHAAVMADQMWRDDRFYAVMRKRLDALESVPLIVKPADTRAKAQRIAEQLGGIEDVPGKWDERFPNPIVEELIEWGVLMGIGLGELIWRTDDEEEGTYVDVAPGTQYSNGKRLRWTARLKIWNPQWLRWDWSLFRYRLMTAQGEITLPDISENPRSDGKWVMWCPYGYTEAWKKGAVRSLARCITRRGWIDRDWARNTEKNGMAIDKAIVPTEAPPEAKDAFFDAVSNRNGETVVMVEQSSNPEKGKFDIELVESKQPASSNFDKAKGDVNKDIAIALLGQNLTTEVGDAGSKAAEKGHADVELNYLRKDAGVGRACTCRSSRTMRSTTTTTPRWRRGRSGRLTRPRTRSRNRRCSATSARASPRSRRRARRSTIARCSSRRRSRRSRRKSRPPATRSSARKTPPTRRPRMVREGRTAPAPGRGLLGLAPAAGRRARLKWPPSRSSSA
jgi:hypothetical protein